MADQKITQLSADTSPTSDDLVVTVNDPSGTPGNRQVTLANLAKGIGGAWASWTPTWTNVTIGNATVVGKYMQIGKTVFAELSAVLGNTSSTSGDMIFSLPVTSAALGAGAGVPSLGVGRTLDSSAGLVFTAQVVHISTTTAAIRFSTQTGGIIYQLINTGASPVTWTNPDEWSVMFMYEAA